MSDFTSCAKRMLIRVFEGAAGFSGDPVCTSLKTERLLYPSSQIVIRF